MTDKSALRLLAARIGNMFSRGRVTSVKSITRMQTLQVDLLDEETKDRLEHFEPYGLTSYPLIGAEVAVAFFDGDRSHGIALVVADRRYRPKDLAPGDVALYDNRGQSIRLTDAGVVIDCAGKPLHILNAPAVMHDGTDIGRLHDHSGVQRGSANTDPVS